jgi:hypothetical protein
MDRWANRKKLIHIHMNFHEERGTDQLMDRWMDRQANRLTETEEKATTVYEVVNVGEWKVDGMKMCF